MRRFLNADSYGSTGHGFLGYNMFAYCGNNPVTCVDYNGSRPRGIQDDNDPVAIDTDQLTINGQGREPYNSMDFGSSTVGQSGCGAIAVHNALLLLGYSSDLRSWIDYFESRWYLRCAGVMPWEIDNALDVAGVSYEGSGDSFISERCKNGGVVILTYWNEVTLISEPATYYRGPVYGYFRNISRGPIQ